MSESFSDLWASSNPVKSQQPPSRTLGAVVSSSSSPSNNPRRTAPDAFSMLASAGSSRSSSRPITPLPAKQQPVLTKHGTTNTGDAFGGLVSFGGSTSQDGSLTIAERAAKVERERRETIKKNGVALDIQGSFWDQYEEGPPVDKPSISIASTNSNGGWDLDFLTSEHTNPVSKQIQPPDPVKSKDSGGMWDLDLMSSESTVSVTPSATDPAIDVFDIDQLATLGSSKLSLSTQPSRTNTPGSFDFGDREDEPLGGVSNAEEDEDDILGSLAKPVEAVRHVSPQPPYETQSVVSTKQSPSRTSSTSPPPHVLGRIVEMGFSVQQAKVALAATSTGLDVDAALEILLQTTSTVPSQKGGEWGEGRNEVERNSKRRQASSRATAYSVDSPSSSHSESSSTHQQGLQDQADKLLAQASTIGMTMFSKANAYWKEGREKVVKAYGEQRVGHVGADAGKVKGRPRWMDNAIVGEDRSEANVVKDGVQTTNGRTVEQPVRSIPDSRRSNPPVSFVAEAEPVYRSPARRRPPASTSSTAPSISSNITPVQLPPIARANIEASLSALAASNAHKATGTEHFKLGRFAEADVAYSRALEALPPSHLLRIPLHNNRALTRLKTGEYKGTIDDATEVVRIVTGDLGMAWQPSREAAGGGENLGDAVGKALRRRAEAFEGLEKWKEATSDWERLSATVWVGHALKGDAIKGAGRCRRMAVGGSNLTSVQEPSKPKPKPIPERVSPSAHLSEALSRVRAANTAQEEEDQARHDLKDVVDARLAAWRAGKETNLRALIASLDVVLSSTFGWQKVSMADLISPGQVKVRYTKAIAKLHPDKLNVNNTTLEERMVANGVFGTLNEAWNAFR